MAGKVLTEKLCPRCGEKLNKQPWGNPDVRFTCDKCGYSFVVQEYKNNNNNKEGQNGIQSAVNKSD